MLICVVTFMLNKKKQKMELFFHLLMVLHVSTADNLSSIISFVLLVPVGWLADAQIGDADRVARPTDCCPSYRLAGLRQ